MSSFSIAESLDIFSFHRLYFHVGSGLISILIAARLMRILQLPLL
jgi:hypothetical protein